MNLRIGSLIVAESFVFRSFDGELKGRLLGDFCGDSFLCCLPGDACSSENTSRSSGPTDSFFVRISRTDKSILECCLTPTVLDYSALSEVTLLFRVVLTMGSLGCPMNWLATGL